MTDVAQQQQGGPYGERANDYFAAGWSPLPLPARAKTPPPDGTTGRGGAVPSGADVWAWSEDHPEGNIALRLPPHVLGVDVDAYGSKAGALVLDALVRQLGELPPTWVSTSRDDGVSGIRLFRVREGLAWPGILGPGIEVIRHEHRYVVAPPSVHPDGRTYRWVREGVPVIHDLPSPDELPWLPDSWVEHFTHGQLAPDRPTAGLLPTEVTDWLSKVSPQQRCRVVEHVTREAVASLAFADGSRHELALSAVHRIVWLAGEGHKGVTSALDDVHAAFMRSVAGDRTQREAESEWWRLLVGAVDLAAVTYAQPGAVDPCDDPVRQQMRGLVPEGEPIVVKRVNAPTLDVPAHDEFWDAREELKHVRDFARARRCSPWAVLGATLALVVVHVPPHVKLPPIVGGFASLNTFVGLVGPSGGGKGAAEAVAHDAFEWPRAEAVDAALGLEAAPSIVNVGSGEGLVHTYASWKRDEGVVMHQTRALFRAAEVDTLTTLGKGRQGSTLLDTLRNAWSGDHLGFSYADSTKRLHLDAHSYRLCLTVGIQPARAGALLDDADGGTPQRFIWLPVLDPDMPEQRPATPSAVMPWSIPQAARREYVMGVCPTAVEAIDAARVALHRGTVDALDGHALLCRLKTAAALALLDARVDVEEVDWQLAGVVMSVSDATRAYVRAELASRREQQAEARGTDEGRRQVAAGRVIERDVVERVRRRVLSKMTESWQASGVLRRSIKADARGHFDDAVDMLVDAGLVESQTVEHRGVDIVQYRLAGSRG